MSLPVKLLYSLVAGHMDIISPKVSTDPGWKVVKLQECNLRQGLVEKRPLFFPCTPLSGYSARYLTEKTFDLNKYNQYIF